MPTITFVEDFDYSPPAHSGRVTLAYRAGTTATVTRDCADMAIAAGKARRARGGARRNEADGDGTG